MQFEPSGLADVSSQLWHASAELRWLGSYPALQISHRSPYALYLPYVHASQRLPSEPGCSPRPHRSHDHWPSPNSRR